MVLVNPNLQSNLTGNSVATGVSNIFTSATGSALSGVFASVPWVRIGEILLGLLLLNVGLAQLSNAVPKVTKTIAKAVA